MDFSKQPVPSTFNLVEHVFTEANLTFENLISWKRKPSLKLFSMAQAVIVGFGLSAALWRLSPRSTEWAFDWINKATD